MNVEAFETLWAAFGETKVRLAEMQLPFRLTGNSFESGKRKWLTQAKHLSSRSNPKTHLLLPILNCESLESEYGAMDGDNCRYLLSGNRHWKSSL